MNRFIGFGWCWLLSLMMMTACDDDNGEATYAGDAKAAFGSALLKVPENVTPLRIPVSLSAPAGGKVKVTGAVKKQENAVEGVDYTFLSKSIEIPAGESVGYFEVEVKDYFEWKAERSFEFELVDVQGAGLAKPDVCRVVINSNEGLPQLGFATTLLSVSEEMPETIIEVELSRAADREVSFRIRPVSGKGVAVFGEDYRLDTLSVYRIPAGELSVAVKIEIKDDILDNGDRSFELELVENTDSQLSSVFGNIKVTILDNEDPVYVSFGKTVLKGIESDTIWVPVKIQGTHKAPVTVTLRAAEGGGSAVENTDYKLLEPVLTLPVGRWVDSVRVQLVDNEKKQPARSFRLGFASVEGALAADKDTLVSVTINDDDFDLVALYDELMGEWTMTSTLSDNSPYTATVTISGGNTPEEEDQNYLKKLILHGDKYVQGGWGNNVDIPLYYDVNTGEITVGIGEVIIPSVNLGGNVGECSIRLEHESGWGKIMKLPTTHTKDYKTIVWKEGKLGGIAWHGDVRTPGGNVLFFIQNVELIRNK